MTLNPKIDSWQGKRFWLVGASSGIGLALARQLLDAGADVAVSARSIPALLELVREYPDQAIALPFDASMHGEWATAYEALTAWRPTLDYLLFSAAEYHAMRAWTLDAERAAHMIDVNLKGAIYGVDTVLPDMLRREHGGIAILASVAGYVGLPRSLIYGPTKAALINFCESLYLDLQDKGIAVHLVNPGFVETPLTAGNDFRMPALLPADTAAHHIMAGLAAGRFEIHFPRRFTNWLKVLRHLPYSLQFKALKGITGS